MQEKMVYAGQSCSYNEAGELMEKLASIEVSISQIQRVTNYYGSCIEKEKVEEKLESRELFCDSPNQVIELKKGEIVYAGLDGSMMLFRKEKFKEVKLGRIFTESSCTKLTNNELQKGIRGWIRNSEYEAYVGNCETFFSRFELLINRYGELGNRLVFLTDGAKWIGRWIEENYPQAIHILDWYHAIEHLNLFAKEINMSNKDQWVEEIKSLLIESKTEEAISRIENYEVKGKKSHNEKKLLIKYYNKNKNRMDYKKYRQIGVGMIGSGAIESAHRTVIQKRCKQSGQRWSKKGGQYVLHLKAIRLSKKWTKVIHLITEPAALKKTG
jgi:hypothetical protein